MVPRWIGLLLIVVGIIGLVYGGITYTRDRKAVEFGPIEIKVREKERIPIPPVLGGVSLAAGIALTVLGSRRR
jgi:hypothetical protein